MELFEKHGVIDLTGELQHLIPFDVAMRSQSINQQFNVPANGVPPSKVTVSHIPGAMRYTFRHEEEDYEPLPGVPANRYDILLGDSQPIGHLHVIRELGNVTISNELIAQVKDLSREYKVERINDEDIQQFSKVFGYYLLHTTQNTD